LARAKQPVVKARKEIKARRDALVIKAVDPTNIAAALERQEIRQWLRSLDLSARQAVALTTQDRLLRLLTIPVQSIRKCARTHFSRRKERRRIRFLPVSQTTALPILRSKR
jgi:hypothetical protein